MILFAQMVGGRSKVRTQLNWLGLCWCVYIHYRPSGKPFYVGKGKINRAFGFSRRNLHHRNIVSKYGRNRIKVSIIPSLTEKHAFDLEKELISIYRKQGFNLVNYTDGGEGCSGRRVTRKQLDALARGRKPGKHTAQSSLDAIAQSRYKLLDWQKTEEGQAHLKGFGKRQNLRRKKAA